MRCKAEVYTNSYSRPTRNCLKKATKDDYCHQHHPDRKEEKKAKENGKRNIEKEAFIKAQFSHKFLTALREISKGRAKADVIAAGVLVEYNEALIADRI